jgi:hypothetical protein
LSPPDQAEYVQLANRFAFADDRNKRNLGMPTFVKHLSMIHTFVCRGDAGDPLRGVVCGIEFGKHSFLINTCQLKRLMARSKSCMNGCFQKLGYSVCRPTRDVGSLFAEILPGFGSDSFIARQWCVRKASTDAQAAFSPSTAVEFAAGSVVQSPILASGSVQVEESVVSQANACGQFDIDQLLNRPAPDCGIPWMTVNQLPPFRT